MNRERPFVAFACTAASFARCAAAARERASVVAFACGGRGMNLPVARREAEPAGGVNSSHSRRSYLLV